MFLHGTTPMSAQEYVSQQGGTLSTTGGRHRGQFMTTDQLATASEHGAGGTPTIVGVAISADLARQLRSQTGAPIPPDVGRLPLLRKRDIHDRPGQVEWIFHPEAIQRLREQGFFFHFDEPAGSPQSPGRRPPHEQDSGSGNLGLGNISV